MEYVPLIEISSEDDFLIPSSSQEFEKIEKVRKNLEEVPHFSNSPEQDQKVPDRYNLRKSLAWDSAFLTGEGILNPEELATMNNMRGKAGITLPGIQEIRKSSESTSSLQSDSLALEQLELNLFDNVRDSIQRSLGSSNHTTNMVHYEEIKEQIKRDASNPRTLKKIDDSSKIKLKTPTALRRHGITRQSQEHTLKDGLVCMKLPSDGNAESKPLIRPPKISSKTISLPTSMPGKKASIEIKKIKGATTKQQSIVAFNKAHGVPGRAPRTTLSTKPTSGTQTGLVLTATLESSSSNLTAGSADPKTVSSLVTVAKRSANRINSYSSLRTSNNLLNVSINGSRGENFHHQNLVKSSLALSNISPANSIDSVVSESSSSTTTSMMLGKSLEGSDAGSSSSSVAFSATFGDSQNSGPLSETFIDNRTKSSINGDCGSRLARPSGLRTPRPTIGYFDKEKTLVRGSNKAQKASLQNALMKNASVNSTSATNKVKPMDHFIVRDRGLSPALSTQASKSAEANFLTKTENHQNLCPKVNKISSETLEQNCKVNSMNERAQAEKVRSCNSRKKEEPNVLHVGSRN
ncbi:uncharacterized protein LOC110020622 [Phalaenopsis equestris]|uniref:uncharacterized protein LOC110020622 n=1 Tax=Phalaenopsis equestris TaxID=78828 RepID=UPI0009E4AA4E|nr:uncharacterized protein LOC110020622 [Phalaenopsis equestris]